jgi:NAD(P)-dependent dehydrogenase (short-subunit alcohol dehydrogenase family)
MPDPLPSVVITGTSTGIGRATALRLDAEGHRIFAGVRREADGEALRREASDRLTPIPLDVTDTGAIEVAVKSVEAEVGEAGLAGVVNNAGIGVAGPIEFVEIDDWRRQFEVNVFGPAAVVKAFLPLVRRARGRIVNVSSAAGQVSNPLMGAYCASKFALEALSDSLRVEVRGSGISVSVVRPGFIEAPVLDKGKAETATAIEQLPPRGRDLYENALRKFDETTNAFRKRAATPEAVAKAIQHALTAPRPKTRYTVGLDSKALTFLGWALPDRARDAIAGYLVGL